MSGSGRACKGRAQLTPKAACQTPTSTDLWVAKVEDLIKQLIDEHKVGLDTLLAKLPAKVALEQRYYLHENRLMVRGCCSAQELWLGCPMSIASRRAGENILATSALLLPVSCGAAKSTTMHSRHRSPLGKFAGQARLPLQAEAPLQASCHPTAE